MCITRRTSRVNSSSTRVQIQSECVRSDMFDACVFMLPYYKDPAGTCLLCVRNLSSIDNPIEDRPVKRLFRAAGASRVGDGDGVAPTPQRERRGDAGGRRRMTTRARPGGQKNPAARVAHAYMDTQLPSVASVRSGRPTRWAGPPGRPPARSRLSTSDVSRLKSTQFGGRAALIYECLRPQRPEKRDAQLQVRPPDRRIPGAATPLLSELAQAGPSRPLPA